MNGRLMVIAAGGTGGHMFPAQALAEAMLAKGWRVQLTTDKRGSRYTGGFPEGVEIITLRSATPARGGAIAKLVVPFLILLGVVAALRRFMSERPDVVVGFGGYPAIPSMSAAWMLRIPRMVHEQNGVLGRVNQLFARRVDAIACGTRATKLPAKAYFEDTGNPVRGAVSAKACAPYIPPGDYPVNLLIVGGSQGARILSDVVPSSLAMLPDEIQSRLVVSQQARPEDVERVAQFYDEAGIRADVRSFYEDIPDRLAQAQLVISRSGASTVADIAVVGRPAIFVPLAAAIRDEQTANAAALVSAGGAVLMREVDLEPVGLAAQIGAILGNPDEASAMARAALGCGVPDATERLVSLVERVAEKKVQS